MSSSVLIQGFKNDECAKTFIRWFSGGEHFQEEWFDCRAKEKPEANIECQYVDVLKTYGESYQIQQDKNGNWLMILNND